MNRQELAKKVADKMMEDDAFSRWLGIQIIDINPGHVVLQMEVQQEMVNGFNISHGGIVFSLADSALAFASNSYGRVALALENNISFVKKITPGDTLTATTEELSLGNRIAVYNVTVTNQDDDTVATFCGTVYRKKEKHFKPDE